MPTKYTYVSVLRTDFFGVVLIIFCFSKIQIFLQKRRISMKERRHP